MIIKTDYQFYGRRKENMNELSPREIKEFLFVKNLKPKKSWGQNFLIDKNIAIKIADTLDFENIDTVVEVGPGFGVLTSLIIERLISNINFIAVEIDPFLVKYLKGRFKGNVKIVQGDILDFDFSDLGNVRIISNLPYKISSPIIRLFMDSKNIIAISGLIQEDFFRRIIGKPSSSDYSPLSIITNIYCKVNGYLRVGPNAFFPKPKVNSRIFTIAKKQTQRDPVNIRQFSSFIKLAFSNRRKMMINNLIVEFNDKEKLLEYFRIIGLSPDIRAEDVSPEEFIELYNVIFGIDENEQFILPGMI